MTRISCKTVLILIIAGMLLFEIPAFLISSPLMQRPITVRTELSVAGEALSSLPFNEILSTIIAVEEASGKMVGPAEVEALSTTSIIAVFVAGVIPFLWATVEFWRRIATGSSFGTGSDSITIVDINDDDIKEENFSLEETEEGGILKTTTNSNGAKRQKPQKRVLGRGALVIAYVLFSVAAFVVGLSIYSAITSVGYSSSMLEGEIL